MLLDKPTRLKSCSILKTSFCYRRVQVINYIHLHWKEKYKVYKIRSSPFVTKGLGKSIELFSDFLRFVSGLKKEPYRGFWWLKDYKGRDIGSINLNLLQSGKEASLSLFKMPTYPKGGSILMETLLFVAFEMLELQKVTLVVFEDNERAYRLYKKYQFEETGTFNYRGRKALRMELTREKYI